MVIRTKYTIKYKIHAISLVVAERQKCDGHYITVCIMLYAVF